MNLILRPEFRSQLLRKNGSVARSMPSHDCHYGFSHLAWLREVWRNIPSQAFRLTRAARLSSVECDPLCQAYFILSRSFIFIYPETAPFNTLLWLDTILCFVCAWGHTIQQLVLQAGSMEKFTVKLHSCIVDCCVKDGNGQHWKLQIRSVHVLGAVILPDRPSCLGCFFGHDPHLRQCRTGPWCCEHVDFCSL